jgi:hypothetical protein
LPSKRYNSKRSFGTRFNDIKETFEVVNKQTPPDQIINEGVDYAQLEVNSIDTTTINYGGISASNFSEGAKIASGESNQRVPSELTDVPYWVQVTSGFAELHKQGLHNDENIQNVEATSDGILFTPTADEASRIYLTGRVPIPKSRKIYSIWESDRAVNLRLIWWKNSHPVEVTNTATTAGVATITTATAHGWIVGNEIRVTGLDVDYNGYHTITAVDTYSISYTSPTLTVSDNLNDDLWETRGSVNLEDYVYEELTNKVEWDADYRSANVSNKVLTNNLATLTTNASHEFVVGDTLRISGIDPALTDPTIFDGTYKVYSVTDTTLSYQKVTSNVATAVVSPAVQIFSLDSESATEYAVYLEIPAGSTSVLLKSAKVFEVIGYGSKEPVYANVNTSVLTSNQVTLTTATPHSFKIDSSVVVSNVGAPYDGTHLISGAPTTNTFTYTVVSTNIGSNSSVVGKAVAYTGKQRSELTPDGLRLYQPDGTLGVDLTTASNSVFNIYNEGNVVTSIDTEGKAVFASVDADNFILDGIDLVGTFANATFNCYSYNKFNTADVSNTEVENSYLNWLARGSVYEGFATPTSTTITLTTSNTYYTLMSGYFTVESGRSYLLQTTFNSLFANNISDTPVSAILRMGTGPLVLGGVSTFVQRSVVGVTTAASFAPMVTQLDAITDGVKEVIIGKRVESNVVTLLLDGNDVIFSNTVVGVTGAGYPYDGYWGSYSGGNLTWSTYTTNTVSYTLPFTASNSATVSKVVTTFSGFGVGTITAGSKQVYVADTSNLYPGFPLTKTSGTGAFGVGATVNNIVSPIEFNATVNHATTGSMTFTTIPFQTTSESYVVQPLDLENAVLTANVNVYYSLELFCSTPNVNVNVTFSSNPSNTTPIVFSVMDIGQAKSDAFQPADDFGRTVVGSMSPAFSSGAGNTGTTVVKTETINADQSAYFDNYGRGTSTTTGEYSYRYSLYQGNPGTASGTKKSAVRFPALGLPSGATITKAEVYLRNRHSYFSSGLTVYIGAHIDGNLESAGANVETQTSSSQVPTARDFSTGSDVFTVTFAKGQGKWVTLPTTWYADIAGDVVRGILLGVTAVPNTWYSGLTNYGYFDGNTMADEPKLRITYEYNA